MDENVAGTITLSLSGPGSNANKELTLHSRDSPVAGAVEYTDCFLAEG